MEDLREPIEAAKKTKLQPSVTKVCIIFIWYDLDGFSSVFVCFVSLHGEVNCFIAVAAPEGSVLKVYSNVKTCLNWTRSAVYFDMERNEKK